MSTADCGNTGQEASPERPAAVLPEVAATPLEPEPVPARVESLAPEQQTLLQRLLDIGIRISSALWTVTNCALETIRSTLDQLPLWREFLTHVKNLPGYILTVIRNGGWWYVPSQEMLEGAAERKSPARRPAVATAYAPKATPSREEEPTPHQKERQAELEARDIEDLEQQIQFERVWPKLTEREQAKVRQFAREVMPPVALRIIPDVEKSPLFRAALRGRALELYGHRARPVEAPAPEAPGLPLKTSRPLDGGFSAARLERGPHIPGWVGESA